MEQLVEGRTGTMPDGTRVIVRGGKIVPIGRAGGVQDSSIYLAALGKGQAGADIKRLEGATDLQQQGYADEATAQQVESLLPNTPVGPLSRQAEFMGKLAPWAGGILGVPTEEQTANIGALARLQNMGTLGSSQGLKGPMSDKDIAFLKGMQYDPTGTAAYNRKVIEAQKWAARRQAAYGSALKSWTQTLGSPSAVNANGLDFGSWWGKYAAERLPPPGVAPRGNGTPSAQGAPRPQAAFQAQGPQPVRVRSPQEARALKPGTPFITPDGRLKYR